MSTLYDFVILLSGNSYICHIEKENVKAVEAALADALNKPNKTICLQDGNRCANLRPEAIQGWYYKPHEKPIQEKMLDTMKKAVEPPEDGWKYSDSE